MADPEPCPIVAEVRARLLQRAELGMGKYGTNLARDDLSEVDWLEHARDEALDLANYLTVLLVRARKAAGTGCEDGVPHVAVRAWRLLAGHK